MKTSIMKNAFQARVALCFILFIDGMGVGLILPLLNSLMIQSQSPFFPTETSDSMRHFAYGSTIGIYMFALFIGSAWLGNLSDILGRKKTLFFSLFFTAIAYIICAVSVIGHSMIGILLGRTLAGFTAGSESIAKAGMMDISTRSQKAGYMAQALLSTSLGFVLGPLFGEFFSNSYWCNSFSLSTPFFFAAALSIVNLLILKSSFPETNGLRIDRGSQSLRSFFSLHPWGILRSGFLHPQIRKLGILYAVIVLGWSGFYNSIALLLSEKHDYPASQIAVYMAVLASGFGIGNSLMVPYLTRRLSLAHCGIGGLCIVGICAYCATWGLWCIWATAVPIGIAMSVVYAALLSLFSHQVGISQQGWVIGISGSIHALTWGFNGFLVGVLIDWEVSSPFILTALCSITAAVILHIWMHPEYGIQDGQR